MHRSVRERFVGLESIVDEYAFEKVQRELMVIRELVIEDYERGVNRMLLLAHHRRLATAVDETWSDIQDGRVEVDAVQVFRALMKTHVPDLWLHLAEPVLCHPRVIREAKLISNLIQNVIKPRAASLNR